MYHCVIFILDLLDAKLKEFYVYNSVTSFTLLDQSSYLVAGLDGGKLEIYELDGLTHYFSHSLDTDSVTCLAVSI